MKKLTANNTIRLIGLFLFLIAIWFLSACMHALVIWFILFGAASLVIIIKRRNFQKMDVIIAFILTLLCLPSSIFMGLFVFPTYLASMCAFRNSNNKIVFFQNMKKKNLLVTIILIILIGGALAAINILPALKGNTTNPSLKLQWFSDAFRAGIFEEIFFRMFIFALCVSITKDAALSKIQNFLCYALMIIPHVLMHFNTSNFNMINIIYLTLFFGLPFAIMQRKQNLLSAMGAHTMVDLIRFCILGI